jgi:ubiquinone biosynthesis protein
MKHGFGTFIEQMNLQRFIPFGKRVTAFGYWPYPEKSTIPQRLRVAFSELGPAFIKLGQLLASRPDLITLPYAVEFEKLQDKAPPFSSKLSKTIIEEELNAPLEDIFMDFETEPIAAASISQVHRAMLKDGTPVIVKVQRPGIKEVIERDIDVLQIIAKLMLKYLPDTKFVNPDGIVEEFSKTIKKEMRFTIEAKNASCFRAKFKNSSNTYIPRVYESLLTDRVFVMERIEGVRIDRIDQIDAMGLDRTRLSQIIADTYFKQIFEDGFFHADPHPGNIFALKDGRIGLIDFGMVGSLSDDLMESIADTMLAFVRQDFDGLVDQYEKLGLATGEVDYERFRRAFRADLMDLLSPLYALKIREIDFAELMENMAILATKHGLKVPRELILVDKTLLFLEHLSRKLDPEFKIMDVAKPYALQLIKKKYDPVRLAEKARRSADDVVEFLISTPKQMRTFLRQMIRGDVTFNIKNIGLDKVIRDIDKSANRLAFSIVLSAIILSSSILIFTEIEEKILPFPLFGLTGYTLAFVLGILLLYSFLKSGRL